MREGYIRVSAATPKIRVADVWYNKQQITGLMKRAKEDGTELLVLPELCLTGYTCEDLFFQTALLENAKSALLELCRETKGLQMAVLVGLPLEYNGCLYNVAALLCEGKILGIVPKLHIPNYAEFYEARHFARGFDKTVQIKLGEQQIPFGGKLLFQCETIPDFTLGVEICEDVWVSCPPGISHALAGATVIANLSASDEVAGKASYRKSLVSGQSARLLSAYVYADAGEGESTTDLVFAGHNLIAENGRILAEARRFRNEAVVADIDLECLKNERRRNGTFITEGREEYTIVSFQMEKTEKKQLRRFIDPAPFVPADKQEREKRCEEILMIQAMGLKKRLEHTKCRNAVIGISGGLDSTLALLVTVKAFDMLKLDRKQIQAVTMPCFGTTDRTHENAVRFAGRLGAELTEIPLRDAVEQHFRDIGHNRSEHDVTYENAQARERTQVLMDVANKKNGLVIGTGDMSELVLGWATYNGDHMSMYGVNASVPKTLVRHLVRYCADTCVDDELKAVLSDILDTPVSPELLPPKDGQIAQKTEDIVGPYELHDFYLYYVLRYGYRPQKIYELAEQAFEGIYDRATILKWLKIFYRRFFTQQFKRSCLPDGPKAGSVGVSPRGDLRMPSDACVELWLKELEQFPLSEEQQSFSEKG